MKKQPSLKLLWSVRKQQDRFELNQSYSRLYYNYATVTYTQNQFFEVIDPFVLLCCIVNKVHQIRKYSSNAWWHVSLQIDGLFSIHQVKNYFVEYLTISGFLHELQNWKKNQTSKNSQKFTKTTKSQNEQNLLEKEKNLVLQFSEFTRL